MNEIDIYDVIRNPVITEQATLISENGQVIFDVSKTATKAQIKEAIETLFKVNFELKNKFLNILMTKSFNNGLTKIANAFEKRAEELFKSS